MHKRLFVLALGLILLSTEGAFALVGQTMTPAPQTPKAFTTEINVGPNNQVYTFTSSSTSTLDFALGEVLVKFRNQARANEAKLNRKSSSGALQIQNRPGLSRIFERHKITGGEAVFRHGVRPRDTALASLDRVVKLSADHLKAVRAPKGSKENLAARHETQAIVEELTRDPDVEYAELNYFMEAQVATNDTYASSSGAWGQSFPDLWGLQKLNIESAWSKTEGDGIVVAVSDTGVDYNHPDIAASMWMNGGESGALCSNGVDDDGNGYIDDCRGWNFVWNHSNPIDDHGHGTHVAGTIAAVGNNGLGIVGVAPRVLIMPVKGLNAYGSGSSEDLANGILYAAVNGAKVINASWGGCCGPTPKVFLDAINYAHDIAGVTFVAAAGNLSSDVGDESYGFIPANARNAVTVAAFDHTDARAYFSNFGTKIDVGAPGGGDNEPATAYAPFYSILSLLSGAAPPLNSSLVVGGQYLRLAGTSMAAPHVSGVAALIKAYRPEFTPEQVRQALRTGARDVGTLGFDSDSGYGLLDASRALTTSTPLVTQLTGPVTSTLTGVQSVDFYGTASGPNFSRWRLEYSSNPTKEPLPQSWTVIASSSNPVANGFLGRWNISTVSDGPYAVRLVAINTSQQSFEWRRVMTIKQVVITSPPPDNQTSFFPVITPFRGGQTITIRGTVAPASFQSYSIHVFGNSGGSELAGVSLTNGGLQKVTNGVLGTWDTRGAPADHYTIWVNVTSNNGLPIPSASASVIVDPSFHAGWPKTISSWWANTNNLTSAPLYPGGRANLVIADPSRSQVVLYDHTGVALPGWPQTVDPQGEGWIIIQNGPAMADVTGDGLPEVLAANSVGDVFIWDRNGRLLSGWPKRYYGQFVAADDVDGNGAAEIVVVAYGGIIYLLNSAGTTLPGWPQAVDQNTVYRSFGTPTIADLDRDGRKEIIVMNQNKPGNLYVFKFDGTMMSGWPKAINDTIPFETNWSPMHPAVGDLDQDGNSEIVVGSMDGKMHVFRYDGSTVSGWPQAAQEVAPCCSYSFNSPAVGDINADGKLEVVAGQGSLGGAANYLYAWLGDGRLLPGWPVKVGPFSYPPPSASFFGFGPPALADVDGDGSVDIIASSDVRDAYHAFSLHAYRSDGTLVAGFPKPTVYLGGGRPIPQRLMISMVMDCLRWRGGTMLATYTCGICLLA